MNAADAVNSTVLIDKLQVHSYDWNVKDEFDDNGYVTILSWCLDRDSNPYLLRFHNFTPFCYVELPLFLSNRGRTCLASWTKEKVRKVYNSICYKLGDDHKPVSYVFLKREKLYFFKGYNKKYPMLLLKFNTLKSMYECKKKLKYPIKVKGLKAENVLTTIAVNVWETNIPLERKLLTLRNVKYSQWFEIDAMKVKDSDKISRLEREYVVDWKSMNPIPMNICGEWLTKPRILSYDIETYSDNHNALPDPLASKHVCYMVSVVFQRIMCPETRKTDIILLGECSDTDMANVIKVKTEMELIEKFQELIIKYDPEIITGYNIFGYDNPYLDNRLKRRMKEWSPNVSRLLDEKVEMKSMAWSSSAYKDQDFNWLEMGGRITVDLLPVIKRDFKLPLYKLDYVANYFLKTGKHDVTAKQMFETFELQKCLNDGYDPTTSVIPKIYKRNKEEHIDEDMLRNEWIQEHKQFALDEMKKVVDYCVVDSDLVLDIFEKIHVWIALIQMSNVVAVSPSSLFTRGTQIRSLSQIYDEASKDGIVIDQQTFPKMDFEGGFVFDPTPGIYHYIPCLDFKSLYPTVMIANNIDHRSFVPLELMDKIPDEDCHVIEWDSEIEVEHENDDGETVTEIQPVHNKYKFVKGVDGIIPRLLKRLWVERDRAKKQLKEAKDPVMKAVYNQKQLQIKVNMNSVSSDTPVPVLVNNTQVEYWTIEELAESDSWINDLSGNQVGKPKDNIKVWSDIGWTEINFVIRHPVKTPLIRVNTHTGCVDCTEEHSLLRPNGVQVKPTELEIGDELMHKWLDSFCTRDNIYTDRAIQMGEEFWNDQRVPVEILNSTERIKSAYLFGLLKSELYISNKIGATQVCFLLNCVGRNYFLKSDSEGFRIYINGETPTDKIYFIRDSPSKYNEGYIYDIETKSHHFAAGVGNMIVHNSMYGMFGAQNGGKLPLPYAAAAVTAKSRESTIGMNKFIEGKGHSVVYGDTDSTMPDLGIYKAIQEGKLTPKEAFPIGEKWGEDLTSLFPKPMEVELEKIYHTMLCIKKKYYLCIVLNPETGEPYESIDKMIFKGVPPARRDKCKFQNTMYINVALKVMKRQSMENVYNYIVDMVLQLLTKQISWRDLIIIESVGTHYKSDSYRMKIFKDEMAKIGSPLTPGERIEYVIVKSFGGNSDEKLGYKMRTPDVFLERLNSETPEYLDYEYYLEKKLMNSIEKQLFQIGYQDELKELEEKYLDIDQTRLLQDLRDRGYGFVVDQLIEKFAGDKSKIIDYLLNETDLTKIVKKLYNYHIKRRNGRKRRLTTRINPCPLGTMIELIRAKTLYLNEIKEYHMTKNKPKKIKLKILPGKVKQGRIDNWIKKKTLQLKTTN